MSDREINLKVVEEIASALGDLNSSVVFVGGAVVSVYADDDAADVVRPTEDVDITLKLYDMNQQQLDKVLAEKGFHLDIQAHAICTYRYKGISVDIMPTIDEQSGRINQWYKVGFESLQKINVGASAIQVFSAPCFLATKFDAFADRGQGDYRLSHDFEDIIYVLDSRESIVGEIQSANPQVKEFLKRELRKIIGSAHSKEILSAHLNPYLIDERYKMLIEKVNAIL